MRALSIDEVGFVAGGSKPNLPKPSLPTPKDEPGKPAEKPQPQPETVTVVGARAPNGVGGLVSSDWIGVTVGRPGPVIQQNERADPNNPQIQVVPQIDAVDVLVPVNTSVEARRAFWRRAYGTPPNAIQ
ncbi:hypothetical protein [Aquidulcibacter sp.]|jgi:hypothetical protein|uniref:hypothetical protein n=1 Tax=Aquidulcibacter sp. TaxID=2052990 RepID=UPI003784F96E